MVCVRPRFICAGVCPVLDDYDRPLDVITALRTEDVCLTSERFVLVSSPKLRRAC